MIDFSIPQHAVDFIVWLNKQNLCAVPCALAYAHNLVGVGDKSGSGWAAYCWGDNQIIVAGDLSEGSEQQDDGTLKTVYFDEADQERFLMVNIAHEYCHHIQASEGREPEEDEAESFAYSKVVQYLNETNYNGSNEWTWEKLDATSQMRYEEAPNATLV